MFSLFHEYLITDLNTEKKTKSAVQNIKYILEYLFPPGHDAVNTQCLKIFLF